MATKCYTLIKNHTHSSWRALQPTLSIQAKLLRASYNNSCAGAVWIPPHMKFLLLKILQKVSWLYREYTHLPQQHRANAFTLLWTIIKTEGEILHSPEEFPLSFWLGVWLGLLSLQPWKSCWNSVRRLSRFGDQRRTKISASDTATMHGSITAWYFI